MPRKPRVCGAVFTVLALIVGACDSGDLSLPSDSGTEQLVLIDGDEQEGRPGARLPEDLIVRLVSEAGVGIAGRDSPPVTESSSPLRPRPTRMVLGDRFRPRRGVSPCSTISA